MKHTMQILAPHRNPQDRSVPGLESETENAISKLQGYKEKAAKDPNWILTNWKIDTTKTITSQFNDGF